MAMFNAKRTAFVPVLPFDSKVMFLFKKKDKILAKEKFKNEDNQYPRCRTL